ncbi:hypothetical protein [Streptantibioticus silvisoli]|uniref:Uncharacterized protein n=1 Tax=Streptantibioticus silvisoli TaxID=2705255 RepID=A0ABT6W522_9ACTN|nr:hypothetical protein [Streptantibioticus silvisoli]MDI5965374.1 hypothetical protein [Streptantibioticus silvisoli]
MTQDSGEQGLPPGVSNELSGRTTVEGSVVQAGSVQGGIHFHGHPRAPRPAGPASVEVLVDVRDPVGRHVVLPRVAALAEDPPGRKPGDLTGGEDILGWARSHGAVDFAFTEVFLTVTNRSDTHLTVGDLRAVVLRRDAAVPGALISQQTAGLRPVPELELDLDQEHPEFWEVDPYTGEPIGARPFFQGTHVRLAPDESEKFIVTGCARRFSCTWQLEVEFRPDGGTPFTVRPAPRLHTTGADGDTLAPVLCWQWALKPPRFQPKVVDLGWCRVGADRPGMPPEHRAVVTQHWGSPAQPPPDEPCRCGAPRCGHGLTCPGDACDGRLMHVERAPRTTDDVTAWQDRLRCSEWCGEWVRDVRLPDRPWGRSTADGTVTLFDGVTHPVLGTAS